MSEKFKLDENGMIMDTDPIYEKLDEWHENDEYDKILETIYAIPHEMWSNRLWFRVISALNNKKEFNEARKQIDMITERCTTPADKAKVYYMLGYGYYMEDKEFKALECYEAGIQEDPNDTAELSLQEECKECWKYINDGCENIKRVSEQFIEDIAERVKEIPDEDKIKLSDSEFIMMLAFIPGIRKIPGIDKCIGLDNLFKKYSGDEKQTVKNFLMNFYGIKDIDTLKETFRYEFNIDSRYDDIKAYINGNPNFDFDELEPEGKMAFNACKVFAENIMDKVPEGGLLAWDISERIGLLRYAYSCDLLTNSEYVSGIETFADEAKKYYSSWEEYSKALILGAGFYMFSASGFSFKEAFRFMINMAPLVLKGDIPDCKWCED